jgi:YrbI family 3-deoxy-D-manno-octulosonate 8-phosphate phosphatase
MIKNNLKGKLQEIKLLAMDVDGTLTDASMYYTANGEEMKRFSTRDGMGIMLLRKGGIDTAIITSEDSKIAEARAQKLSIGHIILGCRNKSKAIIELAEELSLTLENIAYIGDDVNDAPIMGIVGISACPSDAAQTVKNIATIVCDNAGGNGAVREFCELILQSQNKLITLNEDW